MGDRVSENAEHKPPPPMSLKVKPGIVTVLPPATRLGLRVRSLDFRCKGVTCEIFFL